MKNVGVIACHTVVDGADKESQAEVKCIPTFVELIHTVENKGKTILRVELRNDIS